MKNKYKHPFQVPKNYFEDLKVQIKQNCKKETLSPLKEDKIKEIPKKGIYLLWNKPAFKIAIASAAAIIIVTCVTLFLGNKKIPTTNQLAMQSDESTIIENEIVDINTLILDNSVQNIFSDFSDEDFWEDERQQISQNTDEFEKQLDELSDEVIEEYIEFEEIDFYDI